MRSGEEAGRGNRDGRIGVILQHRCGYVDG